MRYEFVRKTLQNLINKGWLDKNGSILAICASRAEWEVFQESGFKNVTISNLDDRMSNPDFSPYSWSYQDAQNLGFVNGAFDYVFVSDGLHHCDSPHRGLLEMYRVARKAIVVFESRDSLLMRISSRLKLSSDYEVEAVVGNDYVNGGVNNTEIPNFVYRWTEREFEKTIQSFMPVGKHFFGYFYGLNLPYSRLAMSKAGVTQLAVRLVAPFIEIVRRLVPGQCNSFCMYASKPEVPKDLWPWLEYTDGGIVFSRKYADKWSAPVD